VKDKDDSPKITELKPLLRIVGALCENDTKNRAEFRAAGCITKLIEVLETRQALENFMVVAMQQIFLEDNSVRAIRVVLFVWLFCFFEKLR